MKRKDVLILTGVFVFMLLAAGCRPKIAKDLKAKIDTRIQFKQVIQNPELFLGKTVLWGGVIIHTKNTKEGTLIEILQKPTDSQSRPKAVDISEGRFLALYDGYLDSAIYAQGREVTIAGVIEGKKVLQLGEIEYTYPLVSVKDIHLWPVKDKKLYYYPEWHYYYPEWHYRWWHYPYWWY